MENVAFRDILKSYVDKIEGTNYDKTEKTVEEKQLICNDLNRLIFLSLDKNEVVKSCFLKSLEYSILLSIPNSYVQGMHEIASVFVYYYFSNCFDKFCGNMIDEVIEDKDLNFEEIIKTNQNYKNWEKQITKEIQNIRIVLTNVFTRKYEPLVKDGFKLYEEYAKVFIFMMKKRDINIKDYEVHQYMGSIFTFFFRDVSTIEDAYNLYEIILSCPPSSLFLIFIVYYDYISKKTLVPTVDSNIYKSVILLEKEFMNTLEDLKVKKGHPFSKYAVLFGGVAGVAAAIIVYKFTKRTDE